MTAFFDTLKPMSFGPVRFPYRSYRLHGAFRHHVHEYPHSPGGAIEKLGRSLYQITVQVDFRAQLSSPKYPQLITDLGNLRGMFENGITEKLHIPHVGTIEAMADDWTESCVNTDRSGVAGEIKFIEDQSSAFLVLETIQFKTANFESTAANFAAVPRPPGTDIFRQIDNAVSAIIAVKDQASLFGSLVSSKIASLTQMLRLADETVKELDNPPYNLELVEALHDLWDATQQLARDIQNKGDLLKKYTTPIVMSASQVAAAVFGDTEKTIDILQLNVIPDPYAIPANTTLHYYQAA